VLVDDFASQIGCLLFFALGGVAGALAAHAFHGPALILPTLSGTLTWVVSALLALVHHAPNMMPFAAAG